MTIHTLINVYPRTTFSVTSVALPVSSEVSPTYHDLCDGFGKQAEKMDILPTKEVAP